MRTKFKSWAEPYLLSHSRFVKSCKDTFSSNNTDLPKFLEIGSGKGNFLYKQALHHPECLFYGMEKNVTCAGFFAKKVEGLKSNNLIIIYSDFDECHNDIPANCLDGIFLTFPDPWPKKRHEKRRLLHPKFIVEMAKKIKIGGFLRLKTDNDGLFEYACETLSNLKGFVLLRKEINYFGQEPFDEESEYETNFRKKGLPIHLIVYKKENN